MEEKVEDSLEMMPRLARRSSRYGLDVIEENDVVEEGPFLPVDEEDLRVAILSYRVVTRLYRALIKTPSDSILTSRLKTRVYESEWHEDRVIGLADFAEILEATLGFKAESDTEFRVDLCRGLCLQILRCEKALMSKSDPRRKLYKANACILFEDVLLTLDFLRKHGCGRPALGSRAVRWEKLGEKAQVAGQICFVGRTHFHRGMWVGLRLDTPTGLNNGTVGGVSYFSCKEKHGLFSRAGRITITKLPWDVVDDTEGESDEGDGEGVVEFRHNWKSGSLSSSSSIIDATINNNNNNNTTTKTKKLEEEEEEVSKGRPRRSSRYGLDVIEESDIVEEGPFLPVDEMEEQRGIDSHHVVMRLYRALIKTPSDATLTSRLKTRVYESEWHEDRVIGLADFAEILDATLGFEAESPREFRVDLCRGLCLQILRCEKALMSKSDPRRELYKANACILFEDVLLTLDFLRKHGCGRPALGSRVVRWEKLGEKAQVAGQVCFVGRTQFKKGMWVGMRLDTPVGLNNGTVGGVSYFSCKEKHGLFSRAGRITITKLPWDVVDDTEGESDEGDGEGLVKFKEEWSSIDVVTKHDDDDDDDDNDDDDIVKRDGEEQEHDDEIKNKTFNKTFMSVHTFPTTQEAYVSRDWSPVIKKDDTVLSTTKDEKKEKVVASNENVMIDDDFDLTDWSPVAKSVKTPKEVENKDNENKGKDLSSNNDREVMKKDKDEEEAENKDEEEKNNNNLEDKHETIEKQHHKNDNNEDDNFDLTNWSPVVKVVKTPKTIKVKPTNKNLTDWSPVVKAVKTPPAITREEEEQMTTPSSATREEEEQMSTSPTPPTPPTLPQMDSETSRLIFEQDLEHEQWSFLVSPTKTQDRKRPTSVQESSSEDQLQRALTQPVFRRLEEFLNDARFADPPISRDVYTLVTELSRVAVERNRSLVSKTEEIENLQITLQDRESDLKRANNVAQSTSKTLQRSVTSLESQLRTAAEEVKRQTRLIELLQREKTEMKERVQSMRDHIHSLRGGVKAGVEARDEAEKRLREQNEELMRLRVEATFRGGETAAQSGAVKKLANENRKLELKVNMNEDHILRLQQENGALQQRLADALDCRFSGGDDNDDDDDRSKKDLCELVKQQTEAIDVLIKENEASSLENENLVRLVAHLKHGQDFASTGTSINLPSPIRVDAAEKTILRANLDKQNSALSELVDFRTRAVEHIESQSSLIEILRSKTRFGDKTLMNMKTQITTLRSELESLRRPALELRRFVNEIRTGLQSVIRSRAEQTKREASLRRVYRQCKKTLRDVLKSGVTRSCWVSEDSDSMIVPNTSAGRVCCHMM